jgi:hypothetical protein
LPGASAPLESLGAKAQESESDDESNRGNTTLIEQQQEQEMTKRLMATIIFTGDLDPDPDAAATVLEQAGYAVLRMPEEYRPHLAHPRDYFMEVSKHVAGGGAEVLAETEAMMNDLNALVDPFGALADDGGPAGPDHVAFRFLAEAAE